MNEEAIRLAIRQAMKNPNKSATSKQTTSNTKTSAVPVVPLKGKGPQRTKQQPTLEEHGKLGDFTRSNSNPPTRTNNTAIIGYEEVPKTRFSQKHGGGQEQRQTNVTTNNDRTTSLTAETEMVRRAIKLVLNQTGGAPSKKAAKQMAAPKMTRSDRVFQSGKGCGPGSSKSVTLDAIKAINAKETGCIVREQMKDAKPISEAQSQRNANTTRGNYNPMIVE